GEVQAIGGVNEKVEGFFDACQAVGPRDDQGVVIPAANAEHLMLRDDVVAAVAAGRFHVHAVRTVEEALAVLTGQPVEQPTLDGATPLTGFHALFDRRLKALADALRAFGSPLAGPNGRAHRPARVATGAD